MNIYVGNVDFKVSEDQLSELFAGHGSVSSAKIITDKETGRSKGFGFVEMSDDEEGKEAISALNGYELNGRKISVTLARPKEDRPRSNSGSRGGYSNDRNSGGYNKRY
jgi:RNA recognition motif-containing protein